jgi:hypothetical protein
MFLGSKALRPLGQYALFLPAALIKKKTKFSSYIWKFSWDRVQSHIHMRKGFLKCEEMRKYWTIYDEAVSHIWICTLDVLVSCCMQEQGLCSCSYAAFGESGLNKSLWSGDYNYLHIEKSSIIFPCYVNIWHKVIMLTSHNIVHFCNKSYGL